MLFDLYVLKILKFKPKNIEQTHVDHKKIDCFVLNLNLSRFFKDKKLYFNQIIKINFH